MSTDQIKMKLESFYPLFLKDMEAISKFDRGSKNIPGLEQTVGYLRPRLEQLGCQTEVRSDKIYGPNLIARKKGKGTARILMFAHLDTVWPVGTCASRPFYIRDHYAYGAGVSDCSHGVLAQYYCLRALIESGFDRFGEIVLLFNPDEEAGSPYSRSLIEENAKGKDVAFCMESPDCEKDFISWRAGTLNFELEVFGKAFHAGTAPEKGRNAIAELVYKLNKIQSLNIQGAIQNLATISGGIGSCIVADYAKAEFGFRVDNFDVIPKVNEALDSIMKQTRIDGTVSKLNYDQNQGHPPMIKYQGADLFCELVKQTSLEVGIPLREKFCGGASDGGFSSSVGTITLDGLTPMSYDYHTADEKLDLSSIVPRVTLLASLIERISLNRSYWICSGK